MAQYQIGDATYELPDNLTPQQLQGVMDQLHPQEPASFGTRFVRGMATPGMGMARANESLGEAEGNEAAMATGAEPNFPSPEEQEASIKKTAQSFEREKPKGIDWAGVLGQALAPVNVATGVATGGAGSFLGRAFSGAASGALGGGLGAAGEGKDAGGIASGAALGGAAGGALGGVAGAVGAKLSPEAKLLASKGVNLTPGQMAGGIVQNIEDKATSVPIVGDIIEHAHKQGIIGFDRAAADETLSSIGQTVNPKAQGYDLVSDVENKINDAYDKAIPTKGVKIDQGFVGDVNQVLTGAANRMGADQARQLQDTVKDVLMRSMPRGVLDADTFKILDSDLRVKIQQLISYGSTASEKDLGRSLIQVKQALQGALTRQDPAAGQALQDANSAWARYVQIRAAATQNPKNLSVFTPENLLNAQKSVDKSVGKGNLGKGQMPMQDLSSAGQKVLPSTVPDTGTASRLGLLGLLTQPHLWPAVGIGAPAAGALYSSPVLRAMTQLAARGGNQPFANAIAGAAPATGSAVNNLANP